MISEFNYYTLIAGTVVVGVTFAALAAFVGFYSRHRIKTRIQATALLDEQTDLETRLNRARRLVYLSALSGGMAYYLDNILFDINGLVEMMNRSGSSSDLDKLVSMTADKATLGLRVADQLQWFARPQNLALHPVSLYSLVNDAVAQVRMQTSYEIEIATNLNAAVDTIVGDATSLRQSVVNLITNSADAITGGGLITVEVVLEALPEDTIGDSAGRQIGQKQLALKVSDNGQGMSAEVVEHIFQPFFT